MHAWIWGRIDLEQHAPTSQPQSLQAARRSGEFWRLRAPNRRISLQENAAASIVLAWSIG